MEPLYVISVISNPVRYNSRYRLYKEFEERLSKTPGIIHYTVETAHGERPHAITDNNPRHIQLRTNQELWEKEAMINVALSRLPADWKYVAWIDADVEFVRPDWAIETVHQLQHYKIVQMFQDAIDLGPTKEVLEHHTSLGYLVATGKPLLVNSNGYYGGSASGARFGHPGLAWAATREAVDGLGGLLDMAILGSGDHHLALSLIDKAEKSMPIGIHPNYFADVMRYQERAKIAVNGNFGYVPGTLLHHFHGKKINRGYQSRWSIIVDNKFDPHNDIHKDTQGLWKLTTSKPKLRDDIMRYFRSRQEDGIDV